MKAKIEIDFDGKVSALLKIEDEKIVVEKAMDAWGNSISIKKIKIKLINQKMDKSKLIGDFISWHNTNCNHHKELINNSEIKKFLSSK